MKSYVDWRGRSVALPKTVTRHNATSLTVTSDGVGGTFVKFV